MKWVTRERPKIDRIACPWLIRRFIDAEAKIIFVDPAYVEASAVEFGGVPFDIADVEISLAPPSVDRTDPNQRVPLPCLTTSSDSM